LRRGTCIVVELTLGLALTAGAGLGGIYGLRAAGHYLADTEQAALASTAERPVHAIEPVAAGHLRVAPPVSSITTVFPADDDALLAPLRTSPLVKVKLNHGGTSLSLRLDFADGHRAAFKPEQTFYQSNPRREIAAYRVDRLLGLGHVPPAFARTFTVDELIAAIDPTQRPWGDIKVRDEIVARRGRIAGEVSWWIPEIIDAKIQADRVDMDEGIVAWHRYLRAGADIPPDAVAMAAQISDVLLFDFLIDNVDRWTLSNTKGSPDGRVLYFMDNTLSFSPFRNGRTKSHLYLHRAQKFSRRLVDRLRRLTIEEVRAAVHDDGPLGELVTGPELDALMARRDSALAYIDGLVAEHGAAAVLAFP
jgi:hypothetical protein